MSEHEKKSANEADKSASPDDKQSNSRENLTDNTRE